jgi:formate-nitrite transporter family protein
MNLTVPVSEHDHVIGPPDASIVVVNYGDYECPDCKQRHRVVQKVIDELIGSVCFVYRHFPLVKVHPNALRAAEAAEAAAAQNKFWEMHRLLYEQPDKLSPSDLRKHARKIGLDIDRFDREMAGTVYKDQILKSYYDSINYGITGAPTTFINGELYAKSGVELVAIVKATLQAQR